MLILSHSDPKSQKYQIAYARRSFFLECRKHNVFTYFREFCLSRINRTLLPETDSKSVFLPLRIQFGRGVFRSASGSSLEYFFFAGLECVLQFSALASIPSLVESASSLVWSASGFQGAARTPGVCGWCPRVSPGLGPNRVPQQMRRSHMYICTYE